MRNGEVLEIHRGPYCQRPIITRLVVIICVVGLVPKANPGVPRLRFAFQALHHGAGSPSPVQVNVQLHNKRNNGILVPYRQVKERKNASYWLEGDGRAAARD